MSQWRDMIKYYHIWTYNPRLYSLLGAVREPHGCPITIYGRIILGSTPLGT